VKYNEFFKILKKEGWFIVRQKGSHVIMQHQTKTKQLIVPYHAGKEVKKGLLSALMKQANIKITKR
jgi:mRNA interferase HicA